MAPSTLHLRAFCPPWGIDKRDRTAMCCTFHSTHRRMAFWAKTCKWEGSAGRIPKRCIEYAKNCQKVCKIRRILSVVFRGEPGKLMRHNDGVVGEHLDILFHVFALDYRIVVEVKPL